MAASVDAKLLKSTKFPPEFNQKVDMEKVNVEVMKKWIAGKISDILGSEDDVVIELCFNLIEGSRYPDIKKMQIQLTGFLDKDTPAFCKELWKLCLSAQNNPQGVPKELLEAKKLELIQEKIEAEKAAEEARKRREEDQRRERDLNNVRNRERGERARGGGGGGGRGESWRGGRGDREPDRSGGRNYDRRGGRFSRSPPPRRRSRERDSFRAPRREFDSYVPRGRGGRRWDERRRSPVSRSISPSSSRTRSVSRSPPRRRRNSSSISRSPPRRRGLDRSRTPNKRDSYRSGGGGMRSRDIGTSRRSLTPSEASSRSRSPPRRRKPRSPSVSHSPPPKSRLTRARNVSTSRSRSISTSRSRSRSPRRTPSNRARSNTPVRRESVIDAAENSTSARKGRERDERRLTRSNSRSRSRSVTPPRRRHRSPGRTRSRDGEYRKRRRSLQRYEPSKRRRNSSSVSSPLDKRDKKADIDHEDDRKMPLRESETSDKA